MKISLSKLPIVPLLGFGTLLAGCAGKADLVACPQITAPLDTVSAYQLSDEAAALVDMRFNGVSAVCDVQDNGKIRMNLAIGMKLKRPFQFHADGEIHSDFAIILYIAHRRHTIETHIHQCGRLVRQLVG